jgi:DNA-binding MarR family transcriptional regulator
MSATVVKPAGVARPFMFELEHFLPYRLSVLTNTVSEGIAQSYRDKYDISVTEWRILAVLGRYPGMTASEICDRTAMDKVAISRAVKNLVERNLLRRATDSNDRRRMRIHITPGLGERTLREVVPLAQQYETRLLAALDCDEQEALSNLIRKLLARARTLNPK